MIRKIKEKHALAAKYAIFLITTQNLSGYHDDPPKLVNWDGAYYQEKILPEHQIRHDVSELVAENDDVGIKGVDQVDDACAEPVAEGKEQPHDRLVAAAQQGGGVVKA